MSSRLLILALTLAAAIVGGVNLYLTAPDAVRTVQNQLDGQLARGAKVLPEALEVAADRNLGLVAEIAASPEMRNAFARVGAETAPDEALLDQVIRVADANAERRGQKEPRSLAVVATAAGSAVLKEGSPAEFGKEVGIAPVQTALGGERASALATVGDALYRMAAAPVAGESAGAVALGFAVDDAFATRLRDVIGVDVTVFRDGKVVASSLARESRDQAAAAAAGKKAGSIFGFGALPADTFSLFDLVQLPLLATDVTAARARKVEIPGLEGVEVVISAPGVAMLAPLADGQKTTVLLTGVLLVVGLLFTGLARGKGASVDEEDLEALADVAERAAAGDTTAHALEYHAGHLGRIARSLNKLILRTRLSPIAAPAEAGEAEKEKPGSDAESDAEAVAAAAASFAFASEAAPAAPAEPAAEPAAEREPTPGPLSRDPITAPFGDPPFASASLATLERTPAPLTLGEPSRGPAAPLTLGEPSRGPAASLSLGEPSRGPSAPAASSGPDFFAAPAPAPAAAPAAIVPPAPPPGLGAFGAPPPARAAAPAPATLDPFAQALKEAGQDQEPAQPSFLNPDATVVAAVPDALIKATTRAAPARPAASLDDEQAHYEEVYQQFLATRERCGESIGALTFEKFAAKLHKNREALIAKYHCRTVRFTVYVKDGKAALKAAPIGTSRV